MTIASFNKRITFQKPVRLNDGGGGYTLSWSDIETHPTVYASLQPLNASESFQFSKMEKTASHRIVIRAREDVSRDMRILCDGKVYEIRTIQAVQGRKFYLEIIANEKE